MSPPVFAVAFERRRSGGDDAGRRVWMGEDPSYQWKRGGEFHWPAVARATSPKARDM